MLRWIADPEPWALPEQPAMPNEVRKQLSTLEKILLTALVISAASLAWQIGATRRPS